MCTYIATSQKCKCPQWQRDRTARWVFKLVKLHFISTACRELTITIVFQSICAKLPSMDHVPLVMHSCVPWSCPCGAMTYWVAISNSTPQYASQTRAHAQAESVTQRHAPVCWGDEGCWKLAGRLKGPCRGGSCGGRRDQEPGHSHLQGQQRPQADPSRLIHPCRPPQLHLAPANILPLSRHKHNAMIRPGFCQAELKARTSRRRFTYSGHHGQEIRLQWSVIRGFNEAHARGADARNEAGSLQPKWDNPK